MIDPRLIREEPELVRQAMKKRNAKVDLDALIQTDVRRRELQSQLDTLKAERNKASDAIALLKKEKKDASVEIETTRAVGEKIKVLQDDFNVVEESFKAQLMVIPNLPHESLPLGTTAADNVVRRSWGEKTTFDFTPKNHLEIGKNLKLFDFERGAKISGRGFPVYTGLGARLERALINFFLDEHTLHNGFTEMLPPFLVNRASMTGTGQLPKFEEDMYRCTDDDLFLVPTAEVPLTNLHADEVLPEDSLPIKYAGYTACFRREAGSWGKDTRGFLRLHQFNKVEMVVFSHPAKSWDVLENLVSYAEGLLKKLELPYHVLELCTGDMGFGAAKCYDLEVYAPTDNMWLEVSSCSNFTDFQARRANIRAKIDGKPSFVHTLNGSGLATPRVLVALLENHQQADGTVRLPTALRPYLGGMEFLRN